MTVADHLGTPETNKPQELVYGILREPPVPFYGHQAVVTQMTVMLGRFVRRTNLGVVCVSPIDVVLDRERALVLQPDIIFVSAERAAIIGEQVWGAPDLVVEVLSPTTAKRDRTRKLEWYRQHGVKECWLVDDHPAEITVIRLSPAGEPRARTYRGGRRLYSRVLPGFRPSVMRLLAAPAARPRHADR